MTWRNFFGPLRALTFTVSFVSAEFEFLGEEEA